MPVTCERRPPWSWWVEVEAALTALFPPRCVSCATTLAVRPRTGLCEACLEVLEPNHGPRCPVCDLPSESGTCADCRGQRPTFERLRAPWTYGGPLAELLVAAKFRGREDLAAAASTLVAADSEAVELSRGASCCVPVPLGQRRRRERGYNQSTILARALGRAWHLPLCHALQRCRDTAPQSDLPVQERRANVEGAFVARRRVEGTVILVDDVVTSAATVRQAAMALERAGAASVRVVAVARAT